MSDAVARWRDQFAGGMIPFDSAYHDSLKRGESIAEAQFQGALALLEAFYASVRGRVEQDLQNQQVRLLRSEGRCPVCGADERGH